MKDLIAWNEKLEKHIISAHGVKTAIFVTPNDTGVNDKPVALFVHGVNGSHDGMTPLAFEVSHKFRPIFIELPGHGDSAVPNNGFTDLDNLKLWFNAAYDWVKKKYGKPTKIITHSFGSYVVSGLDRTVQPDVVLLSPVPTASRTYLALADIGHRFLRLKMGVRLYNNFTFSYLRGLKLLRIRNNRNLAIIKYLSTLNRDITSEQRRYQTDIAYISAMGGIFDGFKPGVVVMGLSDKVPEQRTEAEMSKIFPDAKILALPGGHFSHLDHLEEITELLLA